MRRCHCKRGGAHLPILINDESHWHILVVISSDSGTSANAASMVSTLNTIDYDPGTTSLISLGSWNNGRRPWGDGTAGLANGVTTRLIEYTWKQLPMCLGILGKASDARSVQTLVYRLHPLQC
jgi:hypothetical protein